MKTSITSVAVIIGTLFLAGCGSDAGPQAKVTNSNSTSNSKAPVAVSVDTSDVNDPQQTSVNSNSETGIAQISNVADMKQAKLDKLKSGSGGPAPAGAQPLKREAPDNSQYWSILTDVALETRQFRDNPQIGKVEKINDGRKATVKIYLKTGKVVEVPGEKVPDISRESVTTFITLAGLKPPVAPPPPPSGEPSAEKKRSERIFPKVQ